MSTMTREAIGSQVEKTQKIRVVKLALFLRDRLQGYVDGDVEKWKKEASAEVASLCTVRTLCGEVAWPRVSNLKFVSLGGRWIGSEIRVAALVVLLRGIGFFRRHDCGVSRLGLRELGDFLLGRSADGLGTGSCRGEHAGNGTHHRYVHSTRRGRVAALSP